ncbi:SurA N-terminal domain-containing protein [Thiobacter aerophilum]|uniref:Periplasmic chaperone PpiD n=1 Tax=Thiobacter aerophilum TaxID=3121275 RepID=A0ABV0EF57_9BURK
MLSDTIHERMKGWFARILLGLIIISFALFGVDAYFRGTGGAQWVAEVDGQKISAVEFDDLLKREQARLRELGERDHARLESTELRQRVLEELIRSRVLFEAARSRGYDIPEETLLAQLATEPAFQEEGRFSERRLNAFLAQRGWSRSQFLQLLRQEALANQMLGVAVASAIVPQVAAEQLAQALAESREVSRAVMSADALMGQVHVDDAAIEAYYQTHPELGRMPEQIRAAYVVFSPDTLLSGIEINEAQLRDYFQRHSTEFGEPEKRHAAHILIRLGPGASAEEIAAAQKQATDILAQAKAAPERFGELAKRYSQDPASAALGGDLGVITPGSLFPEVERVLFGMKPGEVAGPVRSPAGLHILWLKSVEPPRARSFEEVRERVAEAARREAAQRRFNEEAEKFGDLVYAQFGSLEPAATQYGLKIQTTDWITREGKAPPPFDNERLHAALFAEEAIKERRNTEAIEVAPNTLVAARVLEHKPAGQRPLAEVRAEISRILAREQAVKRAREQGQALLERLRKGEAVASLKFDAPRFVDRRAPAGLDAEALRTVFTAPVETLPSYMGQETADGYVIYRISRVSRAEDRLKAAQQIAPALLKRAQASLLTQAYVDSLRQQAKVTVRKGVLDKSER